MFAEYTETLRPAAAKGRHGLVTSFWVPSCRIVVAPKFQGEALLRLGVFPLRGSGAPTTPQACAVSTPWGRNSVTSPCVSGWDAAPRLRFRGWGRGEMPCAIRCGKALGRLPPLRGRDRALQRTVGQGFPGPEEPRGSHCDAQPRGRRCWTCRRAGAQRESVPRCLPSGLEAISSLAVLPALLGLPRGRGLLLPGWCRTGALTEGPPRTAGSWGRAFRGPEEVLRAGSRPWGARGWLVCWDPGCLLLGALARTFPLNL